MFIIKRFIGGNAMKMMRAIMMNVCVMCLFGCSLSVMAAEPQDKLPVNLIEALKDGIINLTIRGGENKITITIKRCGEANEDLTILAPKGITKLGFTENDTISIGETGAIISISNGSCEVKLFTTVTTMDFDNDGFSLEINQEALLTLPKDKNELSIPVEGDLKVNVRYTFYGFALAGLSGKITDGEIFIKRDDEDNKKFEIRYGNMKIAQ